ncbi:MAG: UDP-glucose 4-epimerase [Halioglobus sp.]|jgi:UDP-glucose 4-epimerase
MTSVVVLGGSGFVGRSLCPALVAAGCKVSSISRSPVIRRHPGVSYVDCNFDNIYQLGELYQQADFIFHLACDTTPATSSRQSSLEVTANLLPSLRLLEYLEHQCKAVLVYLSSGGTVYGDTGDAPCTELNTTSPISYYGASKASLELFFQAYHLQTGNPVVILRPSNIYGPGQLAKQQFGFIPTLFSALQDGSDFNLMGDGRSVRDFLFIGDFVSLCVSIANSDLTADKQCSTYNVGSDEGVELIELIQLAQELTGKTLQLKHLPPRDVDVRSIVLDSSKAKSEFDWRPETAMESGLVQTWNWLSER